MMSLTLTGDQLANQDYRRYQRVVTEAGSMNMDAAATYRMWKNGNSYLLLLRLVSAAACLVLVFSRALLLEAINGFYEVIQTVIGIITIFFWDLVATIRARDRTQSISLDEALAMEIFALMTSLVSFYFSIESILKYSRIHGYADPKRIPALLPLFLVIVVSFIFVCNGIRSYPAYWRHKRDCREIKPLLAFTKTGIPVAILPSPQPSGEILERLSVDSLQEFPGEDGDGTRLLDR
ncbi:hypothetical protein SAMD00023353_2900390 [Rosellinia necatrix]|uniref:Uncharacterized protein n=1 Tax=Rosellinia necatrix TaxID=77044 RepID=A0A1S8A9I0_ROSNE|nr:hypothetical protein SAMD00023353_2900390 [Rosellinia necatrix]